MRKIVSILLIFALTAVGQTFAKDDTLEGVVFDKVEYDYGELAYGADGNSLFTLTNTAETPLIIKDCRASCGCTTPEWSKEPIQPGAQSVIKVGYNTKISGRFSKTISIITNRGAMVLTIKGNVASK